MGADPGTIASRFQTGMRNSKNKRGGKVQKGSKRKVEEEETLDQADSEMCDEEDDTKTAIMVDADS
jgi:hypothetical protein